MTWWTRKRVEQPGGLISVLLDPTAPDGDQDDAAMALAKYDEPEVESALLTAATDSGRDEIIADQAGASLAEIWLRRGGFSADKLRRLRWPALRMIMPQFLRRHPEWEADMRNALNDRSDIDWNEIRAMVNE